MNRKAIFISASVVVHAAVLGGLWVRSVWHVEKLSLPRDVGALATAMAMPEARAGGAPASSGVATAQRRVVRDAVQPTRAERAPAMLEPLTVTVARFDDGAGGGDGEPLADGIGAGRVRGAGNDDGGCASADRCGAPPPLHLPPPPPPPPVVPRLAVVPPAVMRSMWRSGTTEIRPSDDDQLRMKRDKVARVTGVLQVCIGTRGEVTRVAVARSTGYPIYDARLVAAIQDWRYRPYTVDGKPVAACGGVTFVFAPAR